MKRLTSYFESLLEPTAMPPEAPPPAGLAAFYWHYARQARGLVVVLFITGFSVAALDSLVPYIIGRIVSLVSTSAPDRILAEGWREFVAMAVVMLLLRPTAILAQNLITNQTIAAGFSNLVRWQSHW